MPRWLLLILGVLILYLVPSLILESVYGPSYSLVFGDNCWIPDGQGGWQPKGFPDKQRPTVASENIPFFIEALPFFLPLLLILLFLLSPLAQFVEREPRFNQGNYASEKYEASFVEIDPKDKTEID
jgi:hypothetical protein